MAEVAVEIIPLTERLLITIAVAATTLLTWLTLPREHTRYSRIECALLQILYPLTFALMVAAIVLLHVHKISLDAFGCTLIGLTPALSAVRRALELQQQSAVVAVSRKRPSLHGDLTRFRYIRHGQPLEPGTLKNGINTNAKTYIRRARSALESKEGYGKTWYGTVIRPDPHAIHMCDDNDVGDAVRWWKQLNECGLSVAESLDVLLQNPEAALQVRQLLAEICAVGDTVFHFHYTYLKNFVQKKTSLKATSKSLCNEILKTVNLPWGDVGKQNVTGFLEETLDRGQRYGMLFFIILKRSQIFAKTRLDEPGAVGADEIVAVFQRTGSEHEREAIVNKWLYKWGFDLDELGTSSRDTQQKSRWSVKISSE